MPEKFISLITENKNKIIVCTAVLAVLVFAFLWGADAPGLKGFGSDTKKSALTSPKPALSRVADAPSEKPQESLTPATQTSSPQPVKAELKSTAIPKTAEITPEPHHAEAKTEDIKYSEQNGMEIDEETGTDEFGTEPVPAGMPMPVEPQKAEITDKKMTCTLSVRCDTILDNLSYLDEEKLAVVPQDGIILQEQTVEFNEGESAFQVLRREMKRNKIHFEFENTPIYNSAYIEGINNIYEFDCGELSGWMYRVNGWFPNYGCSRYMLKQGDKLEFVYTCDLGRDIGGGEAWGGNR